MFSSEGIIYYVIIMLGYMPGLYVLLNKKCIQDNPLISFVFFGMVFFNVIGSIYAISPEKITLVVIDTSEVASELVLLLLLQAAIFYLIVFPYLAFGINRNRRPTTQTRAVTSIDGTAIIAGIIIIITTFIFYYSSAGSLLILHLISGELNAGNALAYRMEYVYGLEHWPIFNAGLIAMPLLIAQYAYQRAYISGVTDTLFIFSTLLYVVVTLTFGSKAGFLMLIPAILIAHALIYKNERNRFGKSSSSLRIVLIVLVACALLYALVGYIYAYKNSIDLAQIGKMFFYRVFGVYAEANAAAISYVNDNDMLGVSLLPTLRGVLTHERIDVTALMHQYLAGSPGGVNVPFIGEAYLIGGWLGAVLGCVIVFITILLLQEAIVRIRIGNMSTALYAYYAYLSFMLPAIGMFSTLFTFMYPLAIAVLISLSILISKLFQLYDSKRTLV